MNYLTEKNQKNLIKKLCGNPIEIVNASLSCKSTFVLISNLIFY